MKPSSNRPRCATCKHAFTTWEASHPHGCRIYGFKSRRPPSDIVEQSSGLPCQMHEGRPVQKKRAAR